MGTGAKGGRCVGLRRLAIWLVVAGCLLFASSGCTSLVDWCRNGFKVGPNYSPPDVHVADKWIDASNPRVHLGNPHIADWWDVFNDPVLSRLIHEAAAQNLTVRQAAIQIMQAQLQRDIACTELLPQAQTLIAGYSHGEVSRNGGVAPSPGATVTTGLTPSTGVNPITVPSTPIAGTTSPLTGAGTTTTGTSPLISATAAGAGGGVPPPFSRFFNNFGTSMNLAWELDLWGLLRRNLEAADAALDQSMQNYNEIMVQLLANVATQYVEIRTLQKRLELARQNIRLQEPLVAKLDQQYRAGIALSKPAYFQLKSNLDNTRALIPPLEISLRQANNQLCVLLGQPVHDLIAELGDGRGPDPHDKGKLAVRIPRSGDDAVVLGIPGELLLARPDVLAMERQLRIQSAQIGIAEAEMYPHVGINGSIGLAADRFDKLFNQQSWLGSVGPSLAWNIFNYGRLLANVRIQNNTYQQYVLAYQQTVLNANQDAENALVAYLQSLEQSQHLQDSANGAVEVTKYYYNQLAEGYLPPAATSLSYYNQIFTAVNFQVTQQDATAQAEGNIALNLILLYRALGGGWQINLQDGACAAPPVLPPVAPNATLPPVPGPIAPASYSLPAQVPAPWSVPDPTARLGAPSGR
jgi:NodT family efflux transporter outer membrane factor (OMF) lipoprotein